MSTTEGSSFEPSTGAPVGAVPQAPAPGFISTIDPSEPMRLLSRSGDTDVVFRLERPLPFLRHLGEASADRLDRLADYRRILIAGAVVLVAVVALALVMGGAYRKAPSHADMKVAVPAAVAAVAMPVAVAPPLPSPVAAAPVETPAPAVRATPRAKAPVHRRIAHAKKPQARRAAR
jgi:hypothetical protein